MKTIRLPDELNLNPSFSIAVHDYRGTKELSRQQVLLNKNTFSFLQEGTKEVYSDNSSFAIDNSQFLLMKSGHCLMTEKLSDSSKNYRSILFFFSNSDVSEFARKFELNPTNHKVLYSTYSFHYKSFTKRFVDGLLDLSELSITTRQKILKTKFEEIMLYLLDVRGTDFLCSLIAESDQNQKFIQTIESNKFNKLTLKELSFLSNMSISTFKREFRKHFHNSPSKWFQEKRLEHSAFLLKNKSLRPSDIYEEIGYVNLSNFVHAFKVRFGVTPKQYQSD